MKMVKACVTGAVAAASAAALLTAGAGSANAAVPTSMSAQSIVGLHAFLGVQLTARLTSGGVGVPNELVTFTAGGLGQCSGVTNSNGDVTCNANAGGSTVIINGGYYATFAGDATYGPSQARGNFIG